jgi:hypothetical protein
MIFAQIKIFELKVGETFSTRQVVNYPSNLKAILGDESQKGIF